MKEIGGYFELDDYSGSEYYPDALALNCGRNAAVLLIQLRNYSKVFIPDFMCSSLRDALERYGIPYERYAVDRNLDPVLDTAPAETEAVFIVNYYGLLRNRLAGYRKKWKNIIVDNTQDFFFRYEDADNIYSCRKFFGVPDGGYLVPAAPSPDDLRLYHALDEDISFDRMQFVLGRYEKTASEFYQTAAANNKIFRELPLLKMSKLTHNLLCALDYDKIEAARTQNFTVLHQALGRFSLLSCPEVLNGAFMYPFMHENGNEIRKQLQQKKIYVPKLWPDVGDTETAHMLADQIVPIPCDQRYHANDMEYIAGEVVKLI